ncbi:MAG TPA: serine protease [Solirubrobacterales bacterium]|nr:serine protease [Solirubrobacterales bacterium]
MTIRPNEANAKGAAPRRRGAIALLSAFTMLASLVVAATAVASPGSTSTATSNPKATASVIGGHDTTVEKYPSLAFIEGVQATDGYACSGSVVAPRVVLTAGHCVEDLESSSLVEPGLVGVATGVSNLQNIPADKISTVERVLVYPHFDPSQLHGDAGLLILKAPVSATPIALATSADSSLYEPGTKLTIAGWGVDKQGSEEIPNQLQAATVPVEESSRCQKGIRRIYPFLDPSLQVCTIDAPQLKITPCHGDSGGPAIATRADGSMVEVGITSMGNATCKPTSPAVYTRVDQISAWVQKWIAAVEAGGPQPQIRVPKSHIPTLTRERAEELSFYVMEEAFGGLFLQGQEQTIRCARQGKARLKCGVTWWQGPNDYFGRVNVFYAIRQNVVLVGSHYEVHWVNNDCYFRGAHPASCRVHSKRR